ncbi:SDR family NAD(P)-dependent oxidoreductase [Meiothermus hypogaeus]|uniref:Short-chain dehydrogenase n=2 Tax=Meiothermus hypogaeus TaxID=884155 RepID=A0A511R2K4_9DEIN|nr:SDR family NAD(P)-dependent oxidoreductase [Meiothermus hypogaeus]RIH78755.1 Gluconate 5-dehydrogenase [Meiothermus hypogaeus]GEM83557.1 short-chain dehydrogenase [Meiothermus hypogaeus NBRC 106114]
MNTLLIGATGGVGQSLAHQLAGRVSRLWLSGRNGQILAGLARDLSALAVPAELGNELEVQALAEEVGPLDLLLYAAGAVQRAGLREQSMADLERLTAANMGGLALLLKYARFNPQARVAVLGVYPELIAVPGLSAYVATKLGAEGLVSVARKEFRREGVRFCLVRLPAVATGLWAPLGGAPKTALHPDQAAARILEGVLAEPLTEVLEIR